MCLSKSVSTLTNKYFILVNKSFRHFWQTFLHPRVFIFILTGTAIIFFTFLTNNNALEIAISGIASVFIGIGVNNFSSFETHVKDEKKLQTKIGHSLKVMAMAKKRISRLSDQMGTEGCFKIKKELIEIEEFMNLGISLIQEGDTSLDN